MKAFSAFYVAFFFSFIGSVPPGTLNLSVLQLGLERKINLAWRFALAAALIEYLYAWLALEFENRLTSLITENFKLITGVVMIGLGLFSLKSAKKTSKLYQRFSNSGFRRGILLGILNPMALPFWVAVTAYAKSQQWIDLTTTVEKHSYVFGVSIGTLTLLVLLAYLARYLVSQFRENAILKKIPGYVLLALGVYALLGYFRDLLKVC